MAGGKSPRRHEQRALRDKVGEADDVPPVPRWVETQPGWSAPAEYVMEEYGPTAAEADLRDVAHGPQREWMQQPPRGGATEWSQCDDSKPVVQVRQKVMAEIDAEPALQQQLQGAGPELKRYLINRVLAGKGSPAEWGLGDNAPSRAGCRNSRKPRIVQATVGRVHAWIISAQR